jgi:hypothetical protein
MTARAEPKLLQELSSGASHAPYPGLIAGGAVPDLREADEILHGRFVTGGPDLDEGTEPGWAHLVTQAIERASQADLGAPALRVLAAIMLYSDVRGVAPLTVRALARVTSLGLVRTRAALDELEAAALVRCRPVDAGVYASISSSNSALDWPGRLEPDSAAGPNIRARLCVEIEKAAELDGWCKLTIATIGLRVGLRKGEVQKLIEAMAREGVIRRRRVQGFPAWLALPAQGQRTQPDEPFHRQTEPAAEEGDER